MKKYYSERAKLNNPNKSDDPIVREKISQTLKEFFKDSTNHWAYGLKMDEKARNISRESHLNNPKNVGNRKPRTEEQKEKIRIKIKGTKISRNKIIQLNLDGSFIKEWNSLREVNRSDSTLGRKQISDCCKGIRESYAGFIWEFLSQVSLHIDFPTIL